MKHTAGKWIGWLVLCGGMLCHQAIAQSSAKSAKGMINPKTTTRVTLGSSSGTPGTSVVVPIYFTPAEDAKVSNVTIMVNFVSANLKFAKIERGIAAEMGDVGLTSDLKTGKNAKGVATSTLTVKATAPASKNIPSGLLGYITLNISKTGRPAKITLRASATGTDMASKPLKDLRTFNAEVDVLAPGTQPVVACFFFTH